MHNEHMLAGEHHNLVQLTVCNSDKAAVKCSQRMMNLQHQHLLIPQTDRAQHECNKLRCHIFSELRIACGNGDGAHDVPLERLDELILFGSSMHWHAFQ